MMEHLRSIKVIIEIDSTKDTIREELELEDNENLKVFYHRIRDKIREVLLNID